MAGQTTNYLFDYPTSTDYVKDGATAIETLATDVDTTLFTALGGAYPGLRLIKKQTIGTGVSSVTVTGAFSATYENYKIVVTGGTASTSNFARVTLGSTTTGYSQKNWYGVYTNNTIAGAGYSANTAWEALVRGVTNSLNGTFDLQSPNLAKATGMDYQNKELAGGGYVEQGGGFLNDTTQYTAFTLTANSGTWTGGTIYVYGYGAS